MQAHQIASELARCFTERAFNEADTRHQIIDRLLHEVLEWPHANVSCEEHVHPGYMDYVLRDHTGKAVILIEAKKEGAYFELPTRVQKSPLQKHSIKLKTLYTDSETSKALTQAAQYCPFIGCSFACITNGHEFIFFRSFVAGRDFAEQDAIVIPSLSYFSDRFVQAYNLFSYEAITKDRKLHAELGAYKNIGNELNYPKNGILHYDSPLNKNIYAKYLEPIAKRYFGEITPVDKRLMDNCYVFARDTKQVEAGLHKRLSDSLSPFFKDDGGQDISEIRGGGKLAQRIAKTLNSSHNDVLILYGGKGAGKSTFLRRLMYYDPPVEFTLHALPVVIDCLRAPQSKIGLTDYFWNQIIKALDIDQILDQGMSELLKLFDGRYKIALKQELDGLQEGTLDFIKIRNELILSWKSDKVHVANALQAYWKKNGKKVIIAFDNTDQLTPTLQDHCFLSAHNISKDLSCTAIISMREERYCRARTAGVLDAYQNSGFHLAAPDLVGVFTKRLKLVVKDLRQEVKPEMLLEIIPEDAPFLDLANFFSTCLRQFEDSRNALREFLQECSRDNTRLALEFFAQFLSSGYTHAEEMIRNSGWTIINHQVVKPMMVPQRFNYDEDKSLVPNIYQCRTLGGSHFTMLRIFRILRRSVGGASERAGYVSVGTIIDSIEGIFGIRADIEASLDVMLKHGLIEANNRLDVYKIEKVVESPHQEDIGEVIFADEVRITAFGVYLVEHLAMAVAYLELVSLDCGIYDNRVYSELCDLAVQERNAAARGDKMSRIYRRISRISIFLKYLKAEESREFLEYNIEAEDGFVTELETAFEKEKIRVIASAKRNIRQMPEEVDTE